MSNFLKTPISEVQRLQANDSIQSDDLMLLSKQTTNSFFKSYSITIGKLSGAFYDQFKSMFDEIYNVDARTLSNNIISQCSSMISSYVNAQIHTLSSSLQSTIQTNLSNVFKDMFYLKGDTLCVDNLIANTISSSSLTSVSSNLSSLTSLTSNISNIYSNSISTSSISSLSGTINNLSVENYFIKNGDNYTNLTSVVNPNIELCAGTNIRIDKREDQENDKIIYTISSTGGGGGGTIETTIYADIPVGSIICYAKLNNNNLPDNFIACDGAEYNISEYQELYNVIGRTYSNNNTPQGKFNVPNMTSRYASGVYDNNVAYESGSLPNIKGVFLKEENSPTSTTDILITNDSAQDNCHIVDSLSQTSVQTNNSNKIKPDTVYFIFLIKYKSVNPKNETPNDQIDHSQFLTRDELNGILTAYIPKSQIVSSNPNISSQKNYLPTLSVVSALISSNNQNSNGSECNCNLDDYVPISNTISSYPTDFNVNKDKLTTLSVVSALISNIVGDIESLLSEI